MCNQIILLKNKVWKKATIIKGKDPKICRMDSSGKKIKYNKYGNVYSNYGWQIDHIISRKVNGSDELYNLQPLYWKTNYYWKGRITIEKPGMTQKLFNIWLRDKERQKKIDNKYNRYRLVKESLPNQSKNWIKACNDGISNDWLV